ncbi:MAG: hypothetical protein OXH77_05330 [Anaerolineaceae bacterium]|nr:hypothetical protein [Anaerolineaceae bacterium]
MKKLLVPLFALVFLAPVSAQETLENVIFEGRSFHSVDAVIAAHFQENTSGSTDAILHCAYQMTTEVLRRGHYASGETLHCYRTEAEVGLHLARNQALMEAYRQANAGNDYQATTQGRCAGEDRGTPFRWRFYNGAYADVCASHRTYNREGAAQSYWQVDYGATGFKIRGFWGNFFYTYLDHSSAWMYLYFYKYKWR